MSNPSDENNIPESTEVTDTQAVETETEASAETTEVSKSESDESVPTPKKKPKAYKSADKVDHIQVNASARILEPADGMTQPGTLLLSNNTRKEVAEWYKKLMEQIADQQDERSKLNAKQLKEGNWMRWTVQEGVELLVTQDEVKLLEALLASNRTLSSGFEERFLLKESVPATNMAGYTQENPRMQGIMYSPKADEIKDPVMRVRRKLGLAVSRWVPLMTSGFRIELEGASNMELLNLETKLLTEKINISSDTYGYALSAVNAYMDRALINFILDHVTNNTAWNMTKNDLLRHITLADYDQLVTAMASTIFPDGYPIERTMFREVHPSGVVGSNVRKKLNIQRMSVTRWEYLTEFQRGNIHLGKHSGTTQEISERLQRHRDTIREDVPRFVELGNGITVKLQIPTLEEYLRIGVRFQTGLEDHVREALSAEASAEERQAYLARASDVSRVMFLAHWVEGVYTKDKETGEMIPDIVRIKDPAESSEKVAEADDAIRLILEDVAVFGNIADKLMEEIELFINKVKLSFPVITREPNTVIEPGEHPSVIPINPVEVFFTLLRHKILMAGG